MRQTTGVALTLALLLVASPVLAGSIYGRVQLPDGEYGPGVELTFEIQDKRYTGKTDAHGNYRLTPKETGRGELRVRYDDDGSNRITVRSFDQPSRTDLELSLRDGELHLEEL